MRCEDCHAEKLVALSCKRRGTILWGGFFLFREPPQQFEDKKPGQGTSRGATLQSVWFACYSVAVTLLAILFLFWPATAFELAIPCAPSFVNEAGGVPPSLINPTLGRGTHLLAVAIAFWRGTMTRGRSPILARALTIAGTAHAGLFLVFPLPQLVLNFGATCAVSSILVVFVPLFAVWVFVAAFSLRADPFNRVGD